MMINQSPDSKHGKEYLPRRELPAIAVMAEEDKIRPTRPRLRCRNAVKAARQAGAVGQVGVGSSSC
jgi:hypothetical protein